jgi:hypothetical protein
MAGCVYGGQTAPAGGWPSRCRLVQPQAKQVHKAVLVRLLRIPLRSLCVSLREARNIAQLERTWKRTGRSPGPVRAEAKWSELR